MAVVRELTARVDKLEAEVAELRKALAATPAAGAAKGAAKATSKSASG